jgi:hypothetical protein
MRNMCRNSRPARKSVSGSTSRQQLGHRDGLMPKPETIRR